MRKYPHQFSGGQQQRIALAVALAPSPSVLILDEPTTGLDVTIQALVNELIVSLVRERGMATLYVSHNLALLATVCDDLTIMYAGQIVESGPVATVYFRPVHPYTTALIEAVPSITTAAQPRGIPGAPRRRSCSNAAVLATAARSIRRSATGPSHWRARGQGTQSAVCWPHIETGVSPLTTRSNRAGWRPPTT